MPKTDDAVHIKLLKNSNWLGVPHREDVSYYVKEGSALDKALNQAYLSHVTDRVVPMLPERLSMGSILWIECGPPDSLPSWLILMAGRQAYH